VHLHTTIVTPLHVEHSPILLLRTPYGADANLHRQFASPRLAANLSEANAELVEAGYILAFQDVRGKYRSEGEYVMYRAPGHGKTDHVSDTWDTIDWLSQNVPHSNGKVGIFGVSYPGYLSLIPLLGPHPALHAAVPINPVVDAWMGDDFYHNGAFRLFELEYFHKQTGSVDSSQTPRFGHYDLYQFFLNAGNAEGAARALLGNQTLPAWERMARATNYDAMWQANALDRALTRITRLPVPTLNVHAWFDAEDSYGAPAVQAVLQDKPGAPLHFVAGPWEHGQCMTRGDAVGPHTWDSNTSLTFRREVLHPFLDHHLKGAADPKLPAARVFETGRNRWHTMDSWPPRDTTPLTLHLGPDATLTMQEVRGEHSAAFVSDPAKPVPFRVRPIPSRFRDYGHWGRWLGDDQRPFADRPDVLCFTSAPLDSPLTLAGPVFAELLASTTGSDADWVVKLIDAYPDEVPAQPAMGGFQLMVSGDILRGRFRERWDQPAPITPGAHNYRVRLPHLCHTFRRGHRIMVQVQSTWFPLYDRNPQTFVDSIYDAPASAYRAQTHTLHLGGPHGCRIEARAWQPG
jgi:uncharacterized protein